MKRSLWALPLISTLCWFCAYLLFKQSQQPLHPPENHSYAPDSGTGKMVRRTDAPWPDDRNANLFYFIQISDIHVSVFKKKGSQFHLREFLKSTLPMVDPAFVVVTGDLTDAKDGWKMSSQQYKEEWEAYHGLLKEFGVLDRKGFWWDQRGNHDCFNVPGWQSQENFYKEYSAVKNEQYDFQVKQPFGSYAFVAIDACPIHGPSRPFNFFGYFDTGDMNYLDERLQAYQGSNHTFLLSHYPLSTTVTGLTTSGKSFNDLSREFSVFLCGHLHLLVGGLGDRLHALHRQGFVELEMGDLKQHGIFRIISVDHDLISFVDRSILNPETDLPERAPVVLITNPKDARYIVPRHEPLGRMAKSTHIRMLIFHALPIKNITIKMDGKQLDVPVVKAKGSKKSEAAAPLYVAEWNPSLFMDGKPHTVEVCVFDMAERKGAHTVTFRLDGKSERIGGPGEFIMTSRISYWSVRLFFLFYTFVTVGLLLVPKLMSSYLQATRRYHRCRVRYSRYLVKLDEPVAIALPDNWFRRIGVLAFLRIHLIYRDFVYFCHASVFRLVTLASLSETFYPLYFHALYIVVGPYFIGELVPVSTAKSTLLNPSTHRYGFMYVYGMYIDKHWVPLLDTWVFGLLEVAYILFPLTLYLSFCITPPEQLYAVPVELDKNFDEGKVFFFPPRHERRQFPLHRNTKVRMIVAGAVLYQLINTFFIGIFYGPVAVLISPGKTWFVFWACYALWRHRWSEKGVLVDLKMESPPLKPIPVSQMQPARFTLTNEAAHRRNK